MTTNQETSLRERLLSMAACITPGGLNDAEIALLREAAEALAARAEPQAGEWALVPKRLLEQVYGMAREGCESPMAGYRWCERIDEIFHAGQADEDYAVHEKPLPAAMLAAAPSPASRARPEAQGEAHPTGSDREVLLYLMQQFDAESWECPRCGHSEDCATMDSADYLRRYLATPPADRAPGGEVTDAAYRWWLSRRPLAFNEAEHLANPGINTCSDAEKALAKAVAAALAARTGKP